MLSYIALFGAFLACTTSGSSSSYTYCYNYTECENATISTKYAACYGFYGCSGADIDSTYTLAYGELGCYSADIDSKYTYAYGHYGAYGADVEAYKLYSYGYQSSRVADIEPYSNSLVAYFYGYYAGHSADVSCYAGDTCDIWCGNSGGCKDLDFYCYSDATCFYDCSGDDICPTSYSGVDSDITYVTSVGTMRVVSGKVLLDGKLASDVAVTYTDLTDEEITEYKIGNQMHKDKKSKIKLDQDTKDDTSLQLRMTYEQEFWHAGMYQQKRDEDERVLREVEQNIDNYYPNVQAFRNYKSSSHNTRGIFLGVELEEFGTGLIIDIVIIAIVIQSYNYCMKAKAYQQL